MIIKKWREPSDNLWIIITLIIGVASYFIWEYCKHINMKVMFGLWVALIFPIMLIITGIYSYIIYRKSKDILNDIKFNINDSVFVYDSIGYTAFKIIIGIGLFTIGIYIYRRTEHVNYIMLGALCSSVIMLISAYNNTVLLENSIPKLIIDKDGVRCKKWSVSWNDIIKYDIHNVEVNFPYYWFIVFVNNNKGKYSLIYNYVNNNEVVSENKESKLIQRIGIPSVGQRFLNIYMAMGISHFQGKKVEEVYENNRS